jgi:hypothetical protein
MTKHDTKTEKRDSNVENGCNMSAVRDPFLTLPLGANFDPSNFLNSRECSPLGVNEGVSISLGGQISPLGPGARGEVKNGPQFFKTKARKRCVRC